jgi:PAS domain S-box-containing protein
MATDLRKTGISVVGDAPWGTHFCHFYETKQDLLDTLIPYFKAGLEGQEFCLWVVSDSELITAEEAKGALAQAVPDLDRHISDGDIEILNRQEWYFERDLLNLERVKNEWDAKLKQALARGYDGMRASGDTLWLAEKDWQDFFAYEKQINDWITNQSMTVMCTYPLAKSGATEVLDVVQAHQFAIARRQGEWEVIETRELIQAKAEIRRLNDELEQRVAERTNELKAANEELRKEIAERKQAEALLHAKEQEFRAIVENAPDQIIRYDREFRRTYVNPAVAKAYGLPAEALTGKPMGSVIQDAGVDVNEDELAQLRQRIEAVFDTGKSSEFEITWPVPMGRKYFSIRVFPELDLNGSVINVLGIARDITERKHAEEELKREKEVLKKIFDNIPVMIGFVGEDSVVKLVNPEWERSIGWTLKELQEQGVDIFVEAYPDPEYRQEVLDFVAASTGEWVDLKIKVRDGRVIDAACAVVRLTDGTRVAIAQDITDRKSAEDALRRSEDRLRLVIDTVPALIHTGLPDGQLDFFNQRWLDFVGLSLEELSGWKWTAAIHPEDVAAMVERWRAALATGEPYEHEARVRRADGEYRWMVHREVPLRDERGHIVKWYASSIDIEDRKRAEDALRQSEDHLRLVIDTIPTMAWSIRPDGSVDFVNQRWMDYTGLSLEEESEEVARPIHPEDVPRVIERWLVEKAVGEPYEDEMRLRRADGVYRWFLVRTEPLRDEQGDIVKWYGASIDIEDRKQAEEKLKHSKVQLAQAQRLAHIGSWDWDLRTNAVTWSDELYHIFGLQPGTISVAGEVDRFIHPDDLDSGWDAVKRAVASKEPYDYYHRILRPDGTERIARSRGSIMSDERGEPIKVFGATQDVTELKRAEEKLKATSAQLRALSQSVQSAREEEATRIAREIHDELGSSLSRLKWDLELVGKEYLQVEGVANLSKLQEKITAMRALIDDTIDAIRRISAELRPSALDDLGLLAAIRWHARQFEVRTGIVTLLDSSFEDIDLTEQQSTAVFRIFEEAMTNVLRHAQATQVDIKLEVKNGELLLTIRDNGRGITEAEKSDRLSLGLLGMRERANLIGGRLDIEGSEGKGTVVTVCLTVI